MKSVKVFIAQGFSAMELYLEALPKAPGLDLSPWLGTSEAHSAVSCGRCGSSHGAWKQEKDRKGGSFGSKEATQS